MLTVGLRFVLVVGALVVCRLGLSIEPLYRARPLFLLESASILLPPRVFVVMIQTATFFLLAWLAESLFYRKALELEWKEALGDSLRTYSPLALLWSFVLLLLPGLPIMPVTGWWMLLDAGYWLLTLAVGMALLMKMTLLLQRKPELAEKAARFLRSRSVTILLASLLLAMLVALTPRGDLANPTTSVGERGTSPVMSASRQACCTMETPISAMPRSSSAGGQSPVVFSCTS
jgi:hypothetical protein